MQEKIYRRTERSNTSNGKQKSLQRLKNKYNNFLKTYNQIPKSG